MKISRISLGKSKWFFILLAALCVVYVVAYAQQTQPPPSDMDKMRADITFLDCTIRGAMENMGNLSTRVDQLSKEMPDPQKMVLKSDVDATNKLASDANDKITALSARVDDLSKEVDNLKDKVAQLESKKKGQ